MRYAIVDNGRVVNVVEANAPLEANWIASDEAGPGWTYDGQTFTAPPAAPPEPRSILAGWFKAAISQLGKTAHVAGAVAQQPEWKQILWNSATHIREDDADVIAIAAALNIDLGEVFDRAEEIRAAVRGS